MKKETEKEYNLRRLKEIIFNNGLDVDNTITNLIIYEIGIIPKTNKEFIKLQKQLDLSKFIFYDRCTSLLDMVKICKKENERIIKYLNRINNLNNLEI